MGNLVIDTRVTVAKRNLRRIEKLDRTLATQAKELNDALMLPSSWLRELNSISRDVKEAQWKARDYSSPPDDDDQDPFLHIRELRDAIEQIDRKIDELYEQYTPAADNATRLHRDLSQFRRYVTGSHDIWDHLVKGARDVNTLLTPGNYKFYLENRGQIEDLFAEYVDLLRAFALRNAGFIEENSQLGDIFFIADKLPLLWDRIEGWQWSSLAVPSYAELNHKSKAMMLRLGFPEWTLWALPFIQNEFAHVYQEERKTRDLGWASEADPALLADALATTVTGPAYACAALLLRLDPAAVTGASSVMALRSATIIRSLERATEREHIPFDKLTGRLRTEWRDAVRIAGGDAEAFDEATKDHRVDIAVQSALDTVPDKDEFGRPAWAGHWALITNWSKSLRRGATAEINLRESGQNENDPPVALAFLLDAAWLARVGPTAGEDAAESELDDIAARAIRRMREIGPRPATGQSLRSSPKARPVL